MAARRTSGPARAVVVSSALLLTALVIPGLAPAQEAPVPGPDAAGESALALRDRILAVVDEDPILSSDVDRSIVLGLVEPLAGQSDRALRRRVLESLIDQRVRLHEVTRFGIEQVPVEAIEEQVAAIRSRFSSDQELEARLADVGLDLEGLRQLVARQLAVWIYFEEFLGPRIFVSLEEIRQYYEETVAPELRGAGSPVPPIEEVREEIRELLKQQRLNQAIEERTEELRREADILNFFDSEHETLPPVVLEIDS
jgi:hypothetical protein